MYYVYILQSELNDSFYKGCTNDLERRLIEHNSGKEKSTKRYLPWKLVWYTTKNSRSEALVLERKLKNITSKERLLSFIKKHSSSSPDAA
ncbi:MAG TPA: GIY-YIG nuclease family protein [Bacteroidia bacterium]|nr:GIY-YIG nuclease family protein [Bacteroidia bacterium]